MDNEFRRRQFATAGAALMVLGLVVVVAGWVGVHDQHSVVEQIPYLASGGIGGLALVVAGATVLHVARQARLTQTLTALAVRQEALEEAVDRFVSALGQHGDLRASAEAASARRRTPVP